MRKLFTLLFVLITLSSCDVFLEKKENKSDVVSCYEGSWCDKGETKTFFKRELYDVGLMADLPQVESVAYLTYIKSSKTFELQIKRITPYSNDFYEIGENPNSNSNTIEILDDKGNSKGYKKVKIDKMTDYKISFKSSDLEKSFNEKGRISIWYKQSWMETIYGVLIDF